MAGFSALTATTATGSKVNYTDLHKSRSNSRPGNSAKSPCLMSGWPEGNTTRCALLWAHSASCDRPRERYYQSEGRPHARKNGVSDPLHAHADHPIPMTIFSFIGEFRSSASSHHLRQIAIRFLIDLMALTQPFGGLANNLHIGGWLELPVDCWGCWKMVGSSI